MASDEREELPADLDSAMAELDRYKSGPFSRDFFKNIVVPDSIRIHRIKTSLLDEFGFYGFASEVTSDKRFGVGIRISKGFPLELLFSERIEYLFNASDLDSRSDHLRICLSVDNNNNIEAQTGRSNRLRLNEPFGAWVVATMADLSRVIQEHNTKQLSASNAV